MTNHPEDTQKILDAIAEINEKLNPVYEIYRNARGAWLVLKWVLVAIAMIGAAVAAVKQIHYLK